MRRFILGVMLGFACAAQAAPQYNVCEAQVVRDVTERLGLTVKYVAFQWSYEDQRGMEEPSQALVYVEECPGFHLYELHATFETCVARAHYGTPPDYTFYRGPNGGCRDP